jgi:hypothetical protein
MTRRIAARYNAIFRQAVIAGAALFVGLVPVQASEPKVPPATSPDGVAVAILGPGVDYRVPALRDRLARDGEGDLISWDFADGDIRPFEDALPGRGTPYALAVLNANAAATLVFVREKPGDPQSFGHMMSFVAKTPARIVMWPDARPTRPDWPILIEAAKRFRKHLFIIPRDVGAEPGPFAPLGALANIILVDVQRTPSTATATLPATALSAAAGRAAQLLAKGSTRSIPEIAADIRKEMVAKPNAWQPAIVRNRP